MRHIKSIISEISNLIDRRVELIEASSPGTVEQTTRELIKQGTEPAEAASKALEQQAQCIADDIELEAVTDRSVEVYNEMSVRVNSEREKRIATAEQKLENDFLRWMSGDGVKLFEDEIVRERVFIFSNAADAGIKALEKAVAIPNLRDGFTWRKWRTRRPQRRELASLSTRKLPHVEQADGGSGWEDLPALIEALRG